MAQTMRFRRPTIHQIHVLQWSESGPESAFDLVGHHIRHMSRYFPEEVASVWQNQLSNCRSSEIFQHRDVRQQLIRSEQLEPIVDEPGIRAALFAYQDGHSLLIHSIWQFAGTGDLATFERIISRLWHALDEVPAPVGEGLLCTGVPVRGQPQRVARALLGAPTAATPMDGATLFLPDRPQRGKAWRAVLFFKSSFGEQSSEAGRLVTIAWPQVVLYRERLDHLYFDIYRKEIASDHACQDEELRGVLAEAFSGASWRRPSRTLALISQAQYSLLRNLGEADRLSHEASRELANLQKAARQAASVSIPIGPSLGLNSILPRRASGGTEGRADETTTAITEQAVHLVDQIGSDVIAMRSSVERADSAVSALRAQADMTGADYTRRLTWIVAVIGVLAAVPPLMDENLSKKIYSASRANALWRNLFAADLPSEYEVLFVRIAVVAVLSLTTWLIVRLIGAVRSRPRRR